MLITFYYSPLKTYLWSFKCVSEVIMSLGGEQLPQYESSGQQGHSRNCAPSILMHGNEMRGKKSQDVA